MREHTHDELKLNVRHWVYQAVFEELDSVYEINGRLAGAMATAATNAIEDKYDELWDNEELWDSE